ncbi:hypothetical protein PSTT_01413, partial [Puccinia striiformis]
TCPPLTTHARARAVVRIRVLDQLGTGHDQKGVLLRVYTIYDQELGVTQLSPSPFTSYDCHPTFRKRVRREYLCPESRLPTRSMGFEDGLSGQRFLRNSQPEVLTATARYIMGGGLSNITKFPLDSQYLSSVRWSAKTRTNGTGLTNTCFGLDETLPSLHSLMHDEYITIMIASHLLLVGMWLVKISSGLTASVGGPAFAIAVNQAEGGTSRGLRALLVEEEPQRRPGCMIPFRRKRRKIVRSKKGRCDSLITRPVEFMDGFAHGFPLGRFGNNQELEFKPRYAAQFTECEAEIQKQLGWLEENKFRDVDEMITTALSQDLPKAKELFNEIKEGIKVLKNMRLMLLGGAFDIPEELFRLITKSFSRDFLKSVKTFITQHNHLFTCLALKFEPKNPKFDIRKINDYSFEIIDFLLEHQFISPEEVRDILQDKKMVEQVVNYTVRRYENDLGFSSWEFMVSLTKHWHWKSMNKFLTALSKRELDRIDLVFLIGRLRCIGTFSGGLYDSEVLKVDDRPFVYEKYFGKSTSLDASNSLVSLGFKQGQIGHQIYPELNSKEKDEIIHQLLPKQYGKKKLIRIVELFAFIEEEFCPGIVSQLLKEEKISNELQNLVKPTGNCHTPEDVFHLALIYSRYEMRSHSAEQLIKSVFLDEDTQPQFYVLQDKEIYQDQIDKKRQILNTGRDTCMRLPSVGEFYFGQEYIIFSNLYPHCFEGDLNKMINILDRTRKYEEIPMKLIEKQPDFSRAWFLIS